MGFSWMEYQSMVDNQAREAKAEMEDAEKKFKTAKARYETIIEQQKAFDAAIGGIMNNGNDTK